MIQIGGGGGGVWVLGRSFPEVKCHFQHNHSKCTWCQHYVTVDVNLELLVEVIIVRFSSLNFLLLPCFYL